MHWTWPLALILRALVHSTVMAQEMRLGSGVGDVAGAAELELLFDAQGSTQIASGLIVLRFDPMLISLEERCRPRVGGPLFSTHGVSCGIDSHAGSAVISFQSLVADIPQVLTGQSSFGVFAAQRLVSGGDLPNLLILESVEFRNSDQELVYRATEPSPPGRAWFIEGWPEDVYESDDDPKLASPIGATTFAARDSRGLAGRSAEYQLRSLSNSSDEDWVIIESSTSMWAPELFIRALPAQLPADFQPIVEIYTLGRLFDPDETPVQTVGDCESGARELAEFPSELDRNSLLRITNCVAPSPNGLPYELGLEFFKTTVSGEATASGKVTDATSGQPVQILVLSDSDQIAVSDPSDGEYLIDLPANAETTLRVVSDRYAPAEVAIPELKEDQLSENNDITTFRIPNEVFDDGFEPL